jgi:hypothetical protein
MCQVLASEENFQGFQQLLADSTGVRGGVTGVKQLARFENSMGCF